MEVSETEPLVHRAIGFITPHRLLKLRFEGGPSSCHAEDQYFASKWQHNCLIFCYMRKLPRLAVQ